jgi:hypothetical protein
VKLKIKYSTIAGDEYIVTTSLYVIVLWERKFKKTATDIKMEDLAFMAYEASKLAGITIPAMFDDFIKKIDEISVVEAEAANPTEEA